jgi:CubicO group peptidase (beta-lactamase class C family)
MKKLILCFAIPLIVILVSCLKEGELKQPYKGYSPVSIGDNWQLSDPASENMNPEALDSIYREVYADEALWMIKSLLVFRNGKLVAESYMKDDSDRTRMDAIWSCTKQVNSIITGIALDKGLIGSVQDPIERYLPDYLEKYPDKKGITIENLLTMKSGIDFDNGDDSDILRQHKTDNSLDYILSMSLTGQPGTAFKYKDSDPQILSSVVQSATGKPLDEFGKEVLFDPLGIKNYEWYRYSDGVTLGSWGILTTPRELAKIAQCVLDSGKYNNQQVIPEEWLNEMLSIKVPNAHNELAFGYLWWSYPSKKIYFTWGHGGQYAFIIPSKNMLVLITCLSQVDDDVNVPVEDHLDLAEKIAATAF